MPFLSPDIPAHFKTAVLRRGENSQPTARATFVIEPLSYALAQELGGEVADHLFDDDQQIREELESVTLHPHVGLQRLIARVVPDSDVGRAEIAPVSLVQLKGTRVEDEKKGTRWIALALLLEFDLTTRATREFVIDRFDSVVRLTFEALQGDLLDEDARASVRRAADRLRAMVAAGGGSATLSRDGKPILTLSNRAHVAGRRVEGGQDQHCTVCGGIINPPLNPGDTRPVRREYAEGEAVGQDCPGPPDTPAPTK